ncbi:MAG TPA: efflux RND transporter periplasmic adaptor subunit [Xanthomonadaceae bacterium]|nr:efflux RND transporter periplasmic adaptor subunit [Xanthomonadaceae bacterium]
MLVRDAPTPVAVATARAPASGPVAASVLDASGYVVARRQATVSAKITGKVAEVLIEEGMRVEQGQLMARLDDTDAQAQQELSRGQLAAARSQLGEIQANLSLAERELARQRELLGRGLVSQSALDTAQAQRDALAARLANARSQVAVAGDALGIARIGVDNTVIRAPFAGVVVAKAAQPGEMISPISAGGGFTRTGIGTIVDMDSLEIQVDVAEAYIGRVQPGQPVEAVLNAYPDWKIPASVIAIIPTADRSKATVKVRIALEQKDPRIVPEMGVRVAFLGAGAGPEAPATAQGVLVPANAIVDGAVFVVREGVAERRTIEAGATRGDQWLVLSGLAAGEQVVVAPPASLRTGDAVQVQ